MKKQKFEWVITETDMFVIVKLNGIENCMLQKYHPNYAFNKQQVLQDIEFTRMTGKASVKGEEFL